MAAIGLSELQKCNIGVPGVLELRIPGLGSTNGPGKLVCNSLGLAIGRVIIGVNELVAESDKLNGSGMGFGFEADDDLEVVCDLGWGFDIDDENVWVCDAVGGEADDDDDDAEDDDAADDEDDGGCVEIEGTVDGDTDRLAGGGGVNDGNGFSKCLFRTWSSLWVEVGTDKNDDTVDDLWDELWDEEAFKNIGPAVSLWFVVGSDKKDGPVYGMDESGGELCDVLL